MDGRQKQNMLHLLHQSLEGKTFQQKQKLLSELARYVPTYEHDEKYRLYMKQISKDLLDDINNNDKGKEKVK